MCSSDLDMRAASSALDFEKAARLRDRLQSVARAVERQTMVGAKDEDLDVIGLADDELEASVQIFFVRHGRVIGRKGFVLDKVEELAAMIAWMARRSLTKSSACCWMRPVYDCTLTCLWACCCRAGWIPVW